MNRKLLGWLAAGCVMFAPACSNDEALGGSTDPKGSDDMVTVSFTLSPEGKTTVTRADDNDRVHYPDSANGEFAQISDGTKALYLIFAVYNSGYQLLEQYGDNDKEGTPHYGQGILEVTEGFPVTIDLRLIRSQTYHIAFWAQTENPAEETYYNTNDLTMVEVMYQDKNSKNFKNNDEMRDAFCHTESFTVTGNEGREVILYRPLSQINLGTAGYDFEENSEYLYSKIEVRGAAKYFDVVRNRVITASEQANYEPLKDKDLTTTVSYDYARIPAYINYTALPNNIPAAQIPQKGANQSYDDYFRHFQEQFLRVQLYDVDRSNEPYIPYKSLADANGATDPDTETFKYLSMCYVLVPDYAKNKEPEHSYGTVIDGVTIQVAQNENGASAVTVNVPQVPVQRNWRTNIFGKRVLDQWYNHSLEIDLSPIFNGEYNKDGDEDWWTQDPSGQYPEKGSESQTPENKQSMNQ